MNNTIKINAFKRGIVDNPSLSDEQITGEKSAIILKELDDIFFVINETYPYRTYLSVTQGNIRWCYRGYFWLEHDLFDCVIYCDDQIKMRRAIRLDSR